MIEAPIPADEARRLDALNELGVFYTPGEDRFDRITRLLSQLLNVPMALISLVGDKCQWFKSAQGLRASETPRSVSFCGHAIVEDKIMVISNALEDPRFCDNPLVTGEPYIRFYAGHPLRAPDGSKVGTLCAIDTRPRQMSEAQKEILRDLAVWVENEFKVKALTQTEQEMISELDELRRKVMLDSLTRLWNRQAILEILERELARAERDHSSLALLMLDIDHFKKINDTYGHSVGDEAILEVVKKIRGCIRMYDAAGRYGGEEFLIVLSNSDPHTAFRIANRIRMRIAESRISTPGGWMSVTVSLGLVLVPGGSEAQPSALVEVTDQALYRAKRCGRNRVELGSLAPPPKPLRKRKLVA